VTKSQRNVIALLVVVLAIGAGMYVSFSPAPERYRTAVPEQKATEWEAHLLGFRANRNAFFRSGDSPLRPEDKPRFDSLRFFPPNPAYRVVGRMTSLQPDEAYELENDTRLVARVRVQLVDSTYTLDLFQSPGMPENEYFLPFYDVTAGEETYGGGRYLDVVPVRHDSLLLDFNYAYNPYCTYNPDYLCVKPPQQNFLPIAVIAGEKTFPLEGH